MNSHLAEKLQANHQRRLREQILASCTPDLRAWLEVRQVTYGSDVDKIVTSWPWASYVQSPPIPAVIVSNWTYFDSDSWSHVLQIAAAIPRLPDGIAYLYIHRDGPLFHVDIAELRTYEKSLLNIINQKGSYTLGMVRQDLTHGILFDNYIGYLPDNRQVTGDEIIYEVMWW